ncbi:MAG: biotin/lipoate A/B protein ligase family protein [Cyanobacteria bacterium P01_D01_bin.156]
MAIDEWLLEQHCCGKELPCLRFYTWEPIAISLGYHQRHHPEYWHDLWWKSQKVDLVRRPSGGRAVLHQGDLTYSLIMSSCRGRRRDIYRYLCSFLIDGWQSLGIELQLGTERRYERSTNCFGSSTVADLVTNSGYKVIGSAQLYRNGGLLQHGSMRLNPNPALHKKVFGTELISPVALARIEQADIIQALVKAAQKIFGIKLSIQPLLPQEKAQAIRWITR